MGNMTVITILGMLVITSVFRFRLANRDALPERALSALSVGDVTLFGFLIWSYQYAYELSAGSVLKSPSFYLLFALVATRSLRFHPVPILVTGCFALMGCIGLVLASVLVDGRAAVSSGYVEYLFTAKILIGAEIEKVFGLFAMVACLTYGTIWARSLLHQIDSVIEHLPQGVVLIDRQQRLAVFNNMFRILHRIEPSELQVGAKIDELGPGLALVNAQLGGSEQGEDKSQDAESTGVFAAVHQTPEGQIYSIRQKSMPDGSIVSTTEDVTELQRIQHLAFHDPLTGLGNRSKLDAYLDVLKQDPDCSGAILCIDLDDFKPVNDKLGHQIGDYLLVEVAKRLRACVKYEDLIARTGGDEFIVVIKCSNPQKVAKRIAEDILENICTAFNLDGNVVNIGASIGVRIFEAGLASHGGYLDDADKALYRAKEAGKNQFRFAHAA